MSVSEDELRRRASERAQAKIGFYTHLGVFVFVNILLFFIWFFTGYSQGVFPWFIFVLVFWGIGLVAHFLSVYTRTGLTERMTEQEYRKLKEKQDQG